MNKEPHIFIWPWFDSAKKSTLQAALKTQKRGIRDYVKKSPENHPHDMEKPAVLLHTRGDTAAAAVLLHTQPDEIRCTITHTPEPAPTFWEFYGYKNEQDFQRAEKLEPTYFGFEGRLGHSYSAVLSHSPMPPGCFHERMMKRALDVMEFCENYLLTEPKPYQQSAVAFFADLSKDAVLLHRRGRL